MRKSLSDKWRRLSVETLETRQVLSGMVSARIEGGALVLVGDNADNNIAIMQGSQPGQVVIAGQKSANTVEGLTKVNGSTSPVVLNDFTAGIRAQMLGGNDGIAITDLTVHGSVELSLGSGASNSVSIYGDTNLTIDYAYPQQNPYEFGAARFEGSLIVNGGDGNDALWMMVGDPNSRITGDVVFNAGAGKDNVYLSGSNFDFSSGLVPGDGGKPDGSFDVNGSVVLNLGDGFDTVRIERLRVGHNLLIHDVPTAAGASVALSDFYVGEDVNINTSAGGDSVRLAGATSSAYPKFSARNVYLSTGDGADQVSITAGSVENMYVSTSRGDEGNGHFGVEISGITAANNLYIDTGDGFDNIELGGAVFQNAGTVSAAVSARRLTIITGTGSDGVIIRRTTAGDAVIDTGTQRDLAGVYDSTFSNLRMFLGDADDDLYLGNVTATILAEFDGGAGADALYTTAPNNFRKVIRRSI